jgi:hypothetical protein
MASLGLQREGNKEIGGGSSRSPPGKGHRSMDRAEARQGHETVLL